MRGPWSEKHSSDRVCTEAASGGKKKFSLPTTAPTFGDEFGKTIFPPSQRIFRKTGAGAQPQKDPLRSALLGAADFLLFVSRVGADFGRACILGRVTGITPAATGDGRNGPRAQPQGPSPYPA